MTWTKLSDDYSDDCWALSDTAFRTHTEGLLWSNRKLLDCHIPKEDLRRFAKHPDAVQELLDIGWWAEAGNFYTVRHHAQYQRSRDAVVSQQAANAKNGAKGGRPKSPREQASIIKRQFQTTESVSNPRDGSGTERDRTGQDRHLGADSTDQPNETAVMGKSSSGRDDPAFWKTESEMTAGSSGAACSDCSGPLNGAQEIADGVCADCDDVTLNYLRRREAV